MLGWRASSRVGGRDCPLAMMAAPVWAAAHSSEWHLTRGVSVRRILRHLLDPLRPPRRPTDRELLIGHRAELARLDQLRLAAATGPRLRRSVDVAIVYIHRQIQLIEARLAGRAR